MPLDRHRGQRCDLPAGERDGDLIGLDPVDRADRDRDLPSSPEVAVTQPMRVESVAAIGSPSVLEVRLPRTRRRGQDDDRRGSPQRLTRRKDDVSPRARPGGACWRHGQLRRVHRPSPPGFHVMRTARPTAAILATSLALAATGGRWVTAARGGPLPVADATVAVARAGRVVPRSFLGFSVEYPSVSAYFGSAATPTPGLIRLLRTLDRAQHGPPALRIGGNSADATAWEPTGVRPAPQIRTALGPAFLMRLRAVEARVHAPLALALDLALQQPADAVAFARAAQTALPPGSLQSLEIGNEPDFYARRQPTPRGVLGPPRFPRLRHYGTAQYTAGALRYAAALRAGVRPLPRLVVGSLAGTAWEPAIPGLLHRMSAVRSGVALHAYPLYGCHAGPRRGVSVAGLLAPAASSGLAQRVDRMLRVEHATPSTTRVTELNSVTCGGLGGVSDTFASALWSAATLFDLVSTGVAGADIHTSAGAPYAPFAVTHRNGRIQVQARPLFYGLLLFARAAPAGSRVVPVAVRSAAGLELWSTVDARRIVRIVAINPSTTARVVSVAAPGVSSGTVASISMLRAPGPAARSGVSLGGQAIGPDGRLHGPVRSLRVVALRGRYRVALPGDSAALVTLPGPPAAAAGPGVLKASARRAVAARSTLPATRPRA
ncbi:hypothetical protein FSW04_15245 [Baekduia soli]|uniref:Beta-glucuronidase C-terminal domain-containing protein n=1 Tax=Baekduia soli TaxID=496014 RepID=A0A5B8U6S7_9ACTN|nr:hypothetical protein [Baekduia soli]QEC48796.1 hypothetical protein FSW04_15245 [Baekduia soli]